MPPYRVTSETIGTSKSLNRDWEEDPFLEDSETLEPDDYKNAFNELKTDRGHQAPLASFAGTVFWRSTNILSNITPQKSDLNQGAWVALVLKRGGGAMKKPVLIAFALCFLPVAVFAAEAGDKASLTDKEIRQILIRQSQAGYPGNCPCPYNRAANGSLCGKRSAYSKPGGYAPLCYPADVSDAMVQNYRAQQGK